MKTNILLLGILLILISCGKKEKKTSEITVQLNVSEVDNPFPRRVIPLSFIFMDSMHNKFKGLVNRDSSFVMCLNYVSPRDLKNAIREGNVKNIADTTATKIYVLSGYNNGKQYYIIDLNKNKDFSDDEIIEFNKSITKKENYRDSFNVKNINITKLSKGNFYRQQTYLQFVPTSNLTYKQETEKEKWKNSLRLEAVILDYLYGKFKIGDKEYSVGANKGVFGEEIIFKNSDTTFYSSNHQLFAKYKLKDTVKFDNKFFRIDSLSFYHSKLIIREINNTEIINGFRTNEISKNYVVHDLNGNSTTLKNLAKEKGFLLLDFWGTWCAPCKELTPELVELHQTFSNHIQFASLAFELDPKPVLDYTKTNQMNWYIGIIKGKPGSGDISSPIIGGLRIECYPTFIVIDSDLNILYRTCGGGDNFLGLKDFLNSKFK